VLIIVVLWFFVEITHSVGKPNELMYYSISFSFECILLGIMYSFSINNKKTTISLDWFYRNAILLFLGFTFIIDNFGCFHLGY
jgi:hypothetical protein